MATTAEIQAAIAKAEAKGRKDLADKLRARLSEASDAPAAAPDKARVEAAIAKAEAAGRKDLADKLRAAMPVEPAVNSDPTADLPAPPPRALTPQEERQKSIDDYGLFVMANPSLSDKYKPGDKLPKPGSSIMAGAGVAKSGAIPTTVKPWRDADIRKAEKDATFGDTAAAMMEGPVAGMKAFAGGLTGGESPSRDFLANDPLTRGLPGPVLTGLGAIGDVGGAGLSALGAGVSGVIGLGTEFVPGQDRADERKLGEDLVGMSMFAVPELAGVSSVPARLAGAAPKSVAAVEKVAPVVKAADGVSDAAKLGIPVMRTDVRPPQTFIGKVAQKTGEMIPVAGTGGMRAAQNEARVKAAQNFAREYGADGISPAIDDVAAGLLEKRSAELQKYTGQKREVIEGLSEAGSVPVPKAVAAIDDQIAKLRKQKMAGLEPVIAKLEEFKAAIKDQGLTEIEANRAVIGEAFSGLDMGAIRGVGEKALSAVYGPLRDDMAAFIKSVGGQVALNKWGSANARLSEMAGELGNSALKRALSRGEASPETVRTLLFSSKPSDVKLLYQNLNEQGRASARAAVVQEAVGKSGGLEKLSPDQFKTALAKMGSQIGVFFRGEDLEAATGLVRALKLTERGAVAGVTPPTGVQALPYLATMGLGSQFGMIPGVAIAGTIGGLARLYEKTGVRSALQSVAKAKTPVAERTAMQSLDRALIDAGIAAIPAAGQGASADYEPLWKRYAQ